MLATSLSLVVIFVPIAFMGGIVGRFFSSFGLTVAFAVVMSLFVSFTLTPMLCAASSSSSRREAGHAKSKAGWVYRLVDGGYGGAPLGAAHRGSRSPSCSCVGGHRQHRARSREGMGVNLVPRDDQSEFQVTFITPEGYTLERTDAVIAEIEDRLRRLPGIVHTSRRIGETPAAGGKGQGDVTRGSIYVRIKELEERDYSQFDVKKRARAILHDYPDLPRSASTTSRPSGRDGGSQTFQISLAGPDLEKLAEYADTLIDRR